MLCWKYFTASFETVKSQREATKIQNASWYFNVKIWTVVEVKRTNILVLYEKLFSFQKSSENSLKLKKEREVLAHERAKGTCSLLIINKRKTHFDNGMPWNHFELKNTSTKFSACWTKKFLICFEGNFIWWNEFDWKPTEN